MFLFALTMTNDYFFFGGKPKGNTMGIIFQVFSYLKIWFLTLRHQSLRFQEMGQDRCSFRVGTL